MSDQTIQKWNPFYLTVVERIQSVIYKYTGGTKYQINPTVENKESKQTYMSSFTVYSRDEQWPQMLSERIATRMIRALSRTRAEKTFGLLYGDEYTWKDRMLFKMHKHPALRSSYQKNWVDTPIPPLALSRRTLSIWQQVFQKYYNHKRNVHVSKVETYNLERISTFSFILMLVAILLLGLSVGILLSATEASTTYNLLGLVEIKRPTLIGGLICLYSLISLKQKWTEHKLVREELKIREANKNG